MPLAMYKIAFTVSFSPLLLSLVDCVSVLSRDSYWHFWAPPLSSFHARHPFTKDNVYLCLLINSSMLITQLNITQPYQCAFQTVSCLYFCHFCQLCVIGFFLYLDKFSHTICCNAMPPTFCVQWILLLALIK